MKPTSFKETNIVYTAGNNPNTEQLPVCIADHPDNQGIPTIISKWKLSEDELERINKTGELWLTVLGTQLPPIGATVWQPFDEIGYKPIDLDNNERN